MADPADTGAGRRFAWRLLLIVAAGLGVRVAFVEWFTPHLQFGLDTIWYELTSGLLADGKGLSDPAVFFEQGRVVPTAFRVPLYPAFLAGTGEVFGADRQTFQLAGAVVGAGTIALTGVLGRMVAGATVGLVAAGIVALSPGLVNVDASVMSENLQVPLVTLATILVIGGTRRWSAGLGVAAGLVLGAAVLNRADALAVVVGFVLAFGLGWLPPRRPARERLMPVATLLVGVVLVITPWIMRNERELGAVTLSTVDLGETLAGANCETAYSWPLIGTWDPDCVATPRVRGSEIARRDALVARGRDYALDRPAMLPVVAIARGLRVWGVWEPVSQSRQEAVESRNRGWQLLTWAVFLPTLGLAVAGFVVARRRHLPIQPLLVVIGAVTVGAMLTYGKQRLRAVAEPEVAVLAAIALVAWVRRRRAGDADRDRPALSTTSAAPVTGTPRSSTPSPG